MSESKLELDRPYSSFHYGARQDKSHRSCTFTGLGEGRRKELERQGSNGGLGRMLQLESAELAFLCLLVKQLGCMRRKCSSNFFVANEC